MAISKRLGLAIMANRAGSQARILLGLALMACRTGDVMGQDDFGGGDDAGGMDMDMESMMGDPVGGKGPGGKAGNVMMEELTYIEQTTRALQQLGLVIGTG